jgi:RHS repeat-associated protein
MLFKLKPIAIAWLAVVFTTTSLRADPPEVLFNVQTTGKVGNAYPGQTIVGTDNWSDTGSYTNNTWADSLSFSASISASGKIGSASATVDGSGSGAGGSTTDATALDGGIRLQGLVKDGSTAYVTASSSGSISGTRIDSSGQAGVGTSASWISGSDVGITVDSYTASASATSSQSGTVIEHGGCFSGTITSSLSPSNTFRTVSGIPGFAGSISPYKNFEGSLSTTGEIEYTVEIPDAIPEALIDGPIVGGIKVDQPETGTYVTFSSLSYDPDDQVGTSPVPNICSIQWTLHRPNGSTSTYSGANTYGFTVTIPGPYTITAQVTDNEGATNSATQTFLVEAKRDCEPGARKIQPKICNDNKTSLGVEPFCGRTQLVSHDPTTTRGFPLKNEIAINSDLPSVQIQKWMGNALFTYGAQIALTSDPMPKRILVDGLGNQYDYGDSVSGYSPKTPGVFPPLYETSSGYTLSQAGAPDEMYKSGNFEYFFDYSGRLQTITDPNGNIQEVAYNFSNKPTGVTDLSSQKEVTFGYGSNGLINEVTENGGFAKRLITYDLGSKVTSIVTKNASNATERTLDITYDLDDRMYTVTRDLDTATTATITYQNGGEGVFLGNISFPNPGTTIDYLATPPSGVSYRTAILNSNAGAVYYDYDDDGNLLKITEPAYYGSTTQPTKTFSYDANRNILTASNGLTTYTYTYNSYGLVTRKEDTAGKYTAYTYAGVNLTKIEDNLGTISELAYTDTGLPNAVTATTDGAGNVWTFTHNVHGQVTSVIPPAGSPTGTTTYTYDETALSPEYGWLKSVTNGAGEVTDIDSYSSLGDPTSVTTYPSLGAPRTVQSAYDSTQRETVRTNDDATTVQSAYTGGNLTGVTDEAGTLYEYEYCKECGKMTGISGPLSWAVSWTLDSDKDVASFADANGHDTDYEYGDGKELKKITYPDGQYQQFKYNNYGLIKEKYRRTSDNQTYNGSGNITSDGRFTYTYDNANQLLTATGGDWGNVVTYTYTTNRLVASIVYSFSGSYLSTLQSVLYTYNPDRTVDTVTWKNGSTTVASWQMSYDGAGKVTGVTNSFSETTSFAYDGEGKLLTQTNSNSTSKEIAYNNQRGWPNSITYKNGSSVTESYTMTRDSGLDTVGNITSISEFTGDTVDYTYDDLYRLTEEDRSGTTSYNRTYTYDLAGNITQVNGSPFATYDDGNKLATVLGKNVYHDDDGNITSIASPSPVSIGSISFNMLNRPADIYNSNGFGQAINDYAYNGKRVYNFTGTIKHYIYAGDTLIGELNGSTAQVAYTWGPDGIISKRDLPSSTSSWYQFGPHGETRALINSSGTVTDTYRYNAYGAQTASTGSTLNPYLYGGKFGYYYESSVGLHYVNQRWYSPELMRWLSRDPVRYAGGFNLYGYAKGSPTNRIDPTGWIDCPLTEAECRGNTSTWIPYHGGKVGAFFFHCGGTGYLENTKPIFLLSTQGECFYNNGLLINGLCRGTPNEFDSEDNPLAHVFLDSGGVVISGPPAFAGSIWHLFEGQ